MKSRVHRTVIASLQIAGFVLFSAAAPLAHLHQDDRVRSHRHEGNEEHAPSHGITFHAHLNGHPHDAGAQESGDSNSEDHGQDDSLSISHGRLDSPRVEWPSRPLLALASMVGVTRPSMTSRPTLPDARFDTHRPPLLFGKPSRAPPASC